MLWIYRGALAVAVLAIGFLSFTPVEMPEIAKISDKLNHAVAFLALAFLLDYSFPGGRFGIYKISALLLFGIFIESIQFLIPYRDFSVLDWLADGLGILIFWLFTCTPLYRH